MSRPRPICNRFLMGRCPFSNLTCNLSHNKEDNILCRRWVMGACIGATGNACLYRHFYTERDEAFLAQQRRPQVPVRLNQVESFSSPYTVKVVKETSKQRREEVDLETGKRKSWVEVEEFEVMDLTGESPPPPKAKLNSKELQKLPSPDIFEKTATPKQKPETNPNECPVCGRKFKGEKGVKSHRSSKTTQCGYDKTDKENVIIQSKTPDINSSVIIIPDTPVSSLPTKQPLRVRN